MQQRNGKVRTQQDVERVPPHDLAAERAVIGAMLVSEPAVSVVSGILDSKHFYHETHRVIYEAVMRLYARHEPVDKLTITDELRTNGEFERIGGDRHLYEIIEAVPTAANANRYAKIVRDKATLRRMIGACTHIAESAYGEPQDVPQALDDAEQLIYQIAARAADAGELHSLEELVPEAIEKAERLYEAGGAITGTRLGFPDLDELTGGVHEGDLVIVAARPAMDGEDGVRTRDGLARGE